MRIHLFPQITCSLFSLMLIFPLISCVKATGTTPPLSEEEQRTRLKEAETHGEYYVGRMEVFLKDNPKREPGGTVFLGDSITERFPLEEAFPNQNVINRGIGGDMVAGVIDRLDVSIEALAPKRIYLMIGVNNFLWTDISVDKLAGQYDELLTKIKGAAPQAELIAFTTLPVGESYASYNEKLSEWNERVRKIGADHGIEVIDLTPIMTDAEGNLTPQYTVDGIHLTLAGYMAWMEGFLSPQEHFEAAKNLAPEWNETYPDSFGITKTNPAGENEYPGGRGVDDLVIYTPDYPHETTGTNPWGREAVVEDGVVVSAGSNDSRIPENGFVISGHGDASDWMSANLTPGVSVELRNEEVHFEHTPFDELSGRGRMHALRLQYFRTLAKLVENNAPQEKMDRARELLAELRTLEENSKSAADEAGATADETRELREVLNQLEGGI